MTDETVRWWQWLLLGELVLVIIAAAVTFLPGKTRSDWSFAHLFFQDPTALERFLVNLAAVHVLIGVIVLIFWLTEIRGNRN